jgi:hypothetical protein
LLKQGGLHSIIATNNWTTNSGASKLRQKILSESNLRGFVDSGSYMVFQGASIQTMIYLLKLTDVSLSCPRRRASIAKPNCWIPAFAGMTICVIFFSPDISG